VALEVGGVASAPSALVTTDGDGALGVASSSSVDGAMHDTRHAKHKDAGDWAGGA